MTVADTFWQAFNLYPSLFQTRADVINHLFFVIGNGYRWSNGELIDDDPAMTLEQITETRIARALKNFSGVEFRQSVARILGDPVPTEEEALEEQLNKEFAHKVGPIKGKPRIYYPVCGYSEICNVPNDVRPDWLRLAREACRLLIAAERRPACAGWDADTNRKNAQCGRRVLAELSRRFPRLRGNVMMDRRFGDGL